MKNNFKLRDTACQCLWSNFIGKLFRRQLTYNTLSKAVDTNRSSFQNWNSFKENNLFWEICELVLFVEYREWNIVEWCGYLSIEKMDGIKSARLRQCFHHANNSNINKKRQTRNWTIVLVFHVIYAMFRVTVICRGFKISHRHLQHCLPIVLIYLVTAGFCYPNNVLETANTSDIFGKAIKWNHLSKAWLWLRILKMLLFNLLRSNRRYSHIWWCFIASSY